MPPEKIPAMDEKIKKSTPGGIVRLQALVTPSVLMLIGMSPQGHMENQ
jgi:hypothetical protein